MDVGETADDNWQGTRAGPNASDDRTYLLLRRLCSRSELGRRPSLFSDVVWELRLWGVGDNKFDRRRHDRRKRSSQLLELLPIHVEVCGLDVNQP